SVSGQPAGMTASLLPGSVTPPAGGSASSAMTVNLGPAVTPGLYNLTVTGVSAAVTHTAAAQVTVTSTSGGTTTVIGTLEAAGCIDNHGIANALTSKLDAAQADISAGNTK